MNGTELNGTYDCKLGGLVGQTHRHTRGATWEVREALEQSDCTHCDGRLYLLSAAAARSDTCLYAAVVECPLRAHCSGELHGYGHTGRQHENRVEKVVDEAAEPLHQSMEVC